MERSRRHGGGGVPVTSLDGLLDGYHSMRKVAEGGLPAQCHFVIRYERFAVLLSCNGQNAQDIWRLFSTSS